MSYRVSKRDGSEGSTPDENEKKRMCQEAERGQQGKITQWDPLRQDVSTLWPNGGKAIFALIDVLEKHMKDKCGEVHSAITAGNHERLQQARHKAREMVVDACSEFFTYVRDNSGLVMPPLPEEVDEEYREAQIVKFKCKKVIGNIVVRLPKFEGDDVVQLVLALGSLLVR